MNVRIRPTNTAPYGFDGLSINRGISPTEVNGSTVVASLAIFKLS